MNWEQLKTIFDRALELDGHARVQFLDETCDGDGGLRSEVEDLLEAYQAADDFLSDDFQGSESADALQVGAANTEAYPAVERYRICERIGEGGFGTVYLAEQLKPLQRRVALKVIRVGVSTQSIVKRFEAERQALARMDHPNIAAVFDAGETTAGSPYLVMEYVDGCSIVKYCDDRRLSIRERLALFLDVCAGVQHAHQKGIIHRDIKPSNVLVPMRAEDVIPKVIDFGVAKALEPDRFASSLTSQHQIVGTPVYMSPEQAAAATEKIDTRSDIYSLGVLLYELLTGTTPFDSKTLMSAGMGEMIRVIQTVDPERPSTRVAAPAQQNGTGNSVADGAHTDASAQRRRTDTSTLCRSLRGDLDWIVMRCLEKDSNRRYSTAAALADDLQRYLDDQPVLARPPSVGYRLRKLAKRNKAAALISIALVVALLGGVTASTLGFLRARDARDDAQQAERSARGVTQYLASILGEASPARLGPDATLGEILDRRDDELAVRFEDQPLVEAEVRRTIGDAYSGMGRFEKGAEHLRRAVELYQRELGASSPESLHATVRLAANRRGVGEYEVAEQLLNDVFVAYTDAEGVPVRQQLTAKYELATLLRIQKKYMEAGKWSERVYEESHSHFGPHDDLTLSAQQNLASLYDATDRRDSAFELMTDALAIQVDTLGATHPDTLLSRFNIAIRNCLDGKHDVAMEIYPTLLDDYEARLGDAHRMTNAVRSYFAFELAHVGRLLEADALITSTLAAQQASLPETHRDVVESLRHALEIKEALGAYADAIPLAQQRLEALRQLYGESAAQVLTATINLGASYRSAGDVRQSEALFRQGIKGFRDTLGPTHSETTNSIAHLISLLHELKRYDEEEALIEDGLAAFGDVSTHDHAGYQELRHRRGHFLQAMGRHAEAIEDFQATFYAQVNKIKDSAQVIHYGDCLTNELLGQSRFEEARLIIEHVFASCYKNFQVRTLKLASFLDRHAHCCVRIGAIESGHQSAARALEIRQNLQPENEYSMSGTKMLLGVCAMKLKRYDEAEALLRDVLTVRERELGSESWLLHNTCSVLGECLLRKGAYDEAKALIEQAHAALVSIPSTPKQRLNESEDRRKLLTTSLDESVP